MSNIFYFIGLFLFFANMSRLINYFKLIEIKEWVQKFEKVTQKEPKKSDFKSESDYSVYLSSGFISLVTMFWIICGLISGSWKFFGILLLLSFLFKMILEAMPYFVQKIIGFIYNMIVSGSLILLVINHFHLHKDIFQIIAGLL